MKHPHDPSKLDALEKRQRGVLDLGQNPTREDQPAQLAINESLGWEGGNFLRTVFEYHWYRGVGW
jgi:hypothetical protein